MSYYIGITVEMPFGEALELVEDELAREGFGILTRADVRETFRKKLGVDFRNYVILGACNAPYAFKAFQAEPHIGVLLPCNVVVYEIEHGIVEVAAIDPEASLAAVDNPGLADIASEIKGKLTAMLDRIKER